MSVDACQIKIMLTFWSLSHYIFPYLQSVDPLFGGLIGSSTNKDANMKRPGTGFEKQGCKGPGSFCDVSHRKHILHQGCCTHAVSIGWLPRRVQKPLVLVLRPEDLVAPPVT